MTSVCKLLLFQIRQFARLVPGEQEDSFVHLPNIVWASIMCLGTVLDIGDKKDFQMVYRN
jgi:hypothetical protein